MISDKALYSIAALVLVFGFSHNQLRRHHAAPAAVACWFASATERISGEADRLLSKVEFSGEGQKDAEPDRGAVGCTQLTLLKVQAPMARRQAAFARVEAHRVRLEAVVERRGRAFRPLEELVIDLPKINIP